MACLCFCRNRYLNLPFQAIGARLANLKPIHKVLSYFTSPNEAFVFFVVVMLLTIINNSNISYFMLLI